MILRIRAWLGNMGQWNWATISNLVILCSIFIWEAHVHFEIGGDALVIFLGIIVTIALTIVTIPDTTFYVFSKWDTWIARTTWVTMGLLTLHSLLLWEETFLIPLNLLFGTLMILKWRSNGVIPSLPKQDSDDILYSLQEHLSDEQMLLMVQEPALVREALINQLVTNGKLTYHEAMLLKDNAVKTHEKEV